MKFTKIIATLGPSSADESTIGALIDAGADVFRLNFSHGDHKEKAELIKIIRKAEEVKQKNIAILADLQGPKLRVGQVQKTLLKNGDRVELQLAKSSDKKDIIPIPHAEIFPILESGQKIFINDGQLILQVESCGDGQAIAEVIVGGELSSNKGINLPEKHIPIASLTDKDLQDLQFACSQDVDWLALSFVQTAEDLQQARKHISKGVKLMAKLEKSDAIKNLDEILQNCDAVMIARGDLGIETPMQNVPQLQKHIIRECRRKTIPVVVATQMLDSMIRSPIPTRAEVSDVANAVYDGADAVMLSAESASGEYPIDAVKFMYQIISNSETDDYYRQLRLQERQDSILNDSSDIIAASAIDIGERMQCKAIATFTTTGMTSIRASGMRSHVPIACLTPHRKVARQLGLVWGAYTIKTRDDVYSFEDTVGKATRLTRSHGFTTNGDKIVVTAGVPFGGAGSTNIIRLCTVGEYEKIAD